GEDPATLAGQPEGLLLYTVTRLAVKPPQDTVSPPKVCALENRLGRPLHSQHRAIRLMPEARSQPPAAVEPEAKPSPRAGRGSPDCQVHRIDESSAIARGRLAGKPGHPLEPGGFSGGAAPIQNIRRWHSSGQAHAILGQRACLVGADERG